MKQKLCLGVLISLVCCLLFCSANILAADNIIISYTDSPSGQDGQGIRFYDTTVAGSQGAQTNDGLDSTTGLNTSYAPLEVSTTSKLQWKATEWICYPITVSEAGYYSIAMTYKVAAQPYVYIRTDDAVTKIRLARKILFPATPVAPIDGVGYIWLNEGANNVYLDHNAGNTQMIEFRTLELTKVDSLPTGTYMTWLTPATESAEKTSYDNTGSTNTVNVATGETLTFSVELPASAKYKVSVHGISNGENTVTATIGGKSQSATVADSEGKAATTEIGVLPISSGPQTLTLSGMTDYQLAWIEFIYDSEFVSGTVGTTPADGATVSRGADNFVIHSSDAMDPNATMTATITDGVNEIANVVEVDGSDVIISFTETLDYSKTYTITVSGLKALNESTAMEDKVYIFSTDSQSNTTGTATIGNLEVSVVGEVVTITGNVFGSTGKGIQGRMVSLSNGLSAISGAYGAFTMEYTLPAGTASGEYRYTVNTEYGSSVEISFVYVSQESLEQILASFADPNVHVAAILEQSYQLLGLDSYPKDMTLLKNTGYFYKHFAGKTFADLSELHSYYEKMLLTERMNQSATSSVIYSEFLSDAQVCQTIFSAELAAKISVLTPSEQRTLASDLSTITAREGYCASLQEFYDRITNLVAPYLHFDTVLPGGETQYYETLPMSSDGRRIVIPLGSNMRNVTEMEITITTDNPTFFPDLYHTLDEYTSVSFDEYAYGYPYGYNKGYLWDVQFIGGVDEYGNPIFAEPQKVPLQIRGKTATVKFSFDISQRQSDLGALVLEPSYAGIYSFTVSGKITQQFSEAYSETVFISPSQITVDATQTRGSYDGNYCEVEWHLTYDGVLTIQGQGTLGECSRYSSGSGRDGIAYIKYQNHIRKVIIDGISGIGYQAFSNWFNLEEVVLLEDVFGINDGAFYCCSSLKSINLPDTVTFIGNYAFLQCMNLTSITIPAQLRQIGFDAFAYSGIQSAILPETVTYIGDNAFNSCPNLEEAVIPDDLTYFGACAFTQCPNLKKVTVGNGINNYDTSYGLLFTSCPSLETVILKPGITTIHYRMFCGCISLKELVIPDTVTTIENEAFYGSGIVNLVIPASVKVIESNAFSNCVNLESVYLSDGLTEIAPYLFNGCKNLKNVRIPDSVTEIGMGAFAGCSSLETITLPEGLTTLNNGSFALCSSLKEIIWNKNLTTLATLSFQDCDSLEHLVLPAQMEAIGKRAFMGCDNLKSISLTANTTVIGDEAFANCNSITDIYFIGSPAQWEEVYIGTGNDALLQATVHFSDRLIYNANGGAGAPASYNVTGDVTISNILPTRYGFVFRGWALSADADIAQYQPGDVITVAGDTVLYAVWDELMLKPVVQDDELVVTTSNLPQGSQLIVVCYLGNEVTHITGATTTEESAYEFSLDGVDCDYARVMAWQDLETLKSLCMPEVAFCN